MAAPSGRSTASLLPGPAADPSHSAPRKLKKSKVGFIWCPQTAGSPALRKNRPAAYWPGSRFVDWVGADIYGKYPNFSGLKRFYKQRKKFPFMIGEWSPWDYDNPGFVNALHEWAESHDRVKMLMYYQGFGDDNPFLIQHYPHSGRAMRGRSTTSVHAPRAELRPPGRQERWQASSRRQGPPRRKGHHGGGKGHHGGGKGHGGGGGGIGG